MNWVNQTALITGGSRGIGYEITKFMGQRGAKIIATATSKTGVAKITEMLKKYEIYGSAYQLDLGVPESIDNFFAELKAAGLHPDILINNAGITRDSLFLRLQAKDWQKVIDVNLTGVYRMIAGCLKHMLKKRWGRIINMTSVVAYSGNPGQANYCAAKSGIIGLTKSLALELGSRDITVNAVAPGFIQTDMTAALTEAQQTKLTERIPLGRMGTAKDVAHVVAFLASHFASYITGETMHVNGGLHMV